MRQQLQHREGIFLRQCCGVVARGPAQVGFVGGIQHRLAEGGVLLLAEARGEASNHGHVTQGGEHCQGLIREHALAQHRSGGVHPAHHLRVNVTRVSQGSAVGGGSLGQHPQMRGVGGHLHGVLGIWRIHDGVALGGHRPRHGVQGRHRQGNLTTRRAADLARQTTSEDGQEALGIFRMDILATQSLGHGNQHLAIGVPAVFHHDGGCQT